MKFLMSVYFMHAWSFNNAMKTQWEKINSVLVPFLINVPTPLRLIKPRLVLRTNSRSFCTLFQLSTLSIISNVKYYGTILKNVLRVYLLYFVNFRFLANRLFRG